VPLSQLFPRPPRFVEATFAFPWTFTAGN